MTIEEIETLLRENKPLPKHHTQIDEMTHESLYQAKLLYRNNIVTIEQAQKLRQRVIDWREAWEQTQMLAANTAKSLTRLSGAMAEANKSDCEICKRIAMIYDERIKDNGKQ